MFGTLGFPLTLQSPPYSISEKLQIKQGDGPSFVFQMIQCSLYLAVLCHRTTTPRVLDGSTYPKSEQLERVHRLAIRIAKNTSTVHHIKKGFEISTPFHLNTDIFNLTSYFQRAKLTCAHLIFPGLWRHTCSILQRPSRIRRRSCAFSARVVKYWNWLTASIVIPPSVFVLKAHLGQNWIMLFPEILV